MELVMVMGVDGLSVQQAGRVMRLREMALHLIFANILMQML